MCSTRWSPTSYSRPELAWVALAWLSVTMTVLWAAMWRIMQPRFGPEARRAFRHRRNLPIRLSGRSGHSLDLSMNGARLQVQGDWSRTSGARADLEIELPTSTVRFQVEIGHASVGPHGSTVGVSLRDGQWEALAELARALHSEPSAREIGVLNSVS